MNGASLRLSYVSSLSVPGTMGVWGQTSQKDSGQAPVKYATLVFFKKFNPS